MVRSEPDLLETGERLQHGGITVTREKDEKIKKEREFLRRLAGSDPNDELEDFMAESQPEYGAVSTPKAREGHWVIDLACLCGYEGTVTYGGMDFKLFGKDRKGFLYFECPECKRHLQYDPITGKIRSRKGILGFLFGRFS